MTDHTAEVIPTVLGVRKDVAPAVQFEGEVAALVDGLLAGIEVECAVVVDRDPLLPIAEISCEGTPGSGPDLE